MQKNAEQRYLYGNGVTMRARNSKEETQRLKKKEKYIPEIHFAILNAAIIKGFNP